MLVDRNEYLESICKGKTVLHLGAAEGIDTRQLNKEKNNWLHGRLLKVAKKVIGVDLNPGNETDIIKCDIEDLIECNRIFRNYKNVDIIIMGELIEHLSNPGEALYNIGLVNGELIITTPNNFALRKFLWACLNKEVVSNSHTCYYSVKTLAYLLKQQGYKVTKTLNYAYLGKFGYLQRLFYKFFPMLTDGIIIHCKAN